MCDQAILDLLDRPIAFHRCFVRITGSVTAALMLSQAWHWTKYTKDPDGWFWKSRAEWIEETGLTRFEQESARKRLREKGFLIEKLKGVPATVHFRVHADNVAAALTGQPVEIPPSQLAENQPTRRRKSRQQAGGKPANKLAEIPPTINEHGLLMEYPGNTTGNTEGADAPRARKQSPSKGSPATGRKSVSQKTVKAPAVIEAIREIAELYPPKKLQARILERVGENFDRARLEECYLAWIGRGFRPTNYSGWVLDWYVNGIPEQGGNHNGKSRKSASDNLRDAAEWICS